MKMNKKGSILMISLWILAILVIFALGLGHRASINLRLVKYQRDRLKATYLAKAGINRAIVELEKDNQNQWDSLEEIWSTGIDSVTKKPLFENIEIPEGSGNRFTVKYLYDKDRNVYLCTEDEERKININGIDTNLKKQVLVRLLEFAGVENPSELKELLMKWIDSAADAEDKENIFKNSSLKSQEELLIILEYFYKNRGENNPSEKAQNIYNKIKDLITVYGDEKININTVSIEILNNILMPALFNALTSGSITYDQINDISQRIITVRNNGRIFDTSDIKGKLTSSSNFSTEQQTAFNELNSYIAINSDNFRIASQGKVGNIIKNITTIYDREGKKIVYWHEN